VTVSTPRPSAARSGGPRRAARTAGILALATLVVAVVACGGAKATPSPSPSASGGAVASPMPEATAWPQRVIESVAALGAADAEIWKAGADIARAADAKDVEAMWGAADGTVKLIDGLMPNIEALEGYPHTAGLGAAYRAAFPVMLEGATQIRDSITAGDSAGVVAGSQKLSEGVVLYGKVRAILQPFITDALKMKDSLVQ
jgi:hypothetical protein